jgi:hypothetical protein
MYEYPLEETVARLQETLPVSEYGKGKAKSFSVLLKEVCDGERTIKFNEEGKPLGFVNVAMVIAIAEGGEFNGMRLVELLLAAEDTWVQVL